MEMLKNVGSLMLLLGMSPAVFAGFLSPPLACGDPSCSFIYDRGAYTYKSMNSVLDHSMVVNPNGRYPYKDPMVGSTAGLNKIVKAFNNETASGPRQGTTDDKIVCVGGTILLRPDNNFPSNTAMVNTSGCGPGYASYDEHPGYDYKANYGTTVRASASGRVVNGSAGRCIPNGIGTCASWGYIGIDHQNGYISQYGHLSSIYFSAGQWVNRGQPIGLSGHTAPPPIVLGDHLHFEVLKLIPGRTNNYAINNYAINNYAVVDPYGWVGSSSSNDPLYSRSVHGIAPANLWQ